MYAKKSLGQHFLQCDWVLDELLAAADVSHNDTIVEIGPGTGVLTRALTRKAKKVIAIEKDEHLAEELQRQLATENSTNVEIITGDILTLFPSLPVPASYKIVANIPYYLTARLLRIVLEDGPRPTHLALTIQKEVAERIISKPPHMNLLALAVQVFGTAKIIKNVPASCFSPQPKVDSAIISISGISDAYFKSYTISPALFFKVIKQAFSQKRKLLVNTLAHDKAHIQKALSAAGLAHNARPEELTLAQWALLIKQL